MSEGTTSYSALLCSNVVQFHFINSFLWTSESQLRGSTLLCFHSAVPGVCLCIAVSIKISLRDRIQSILMELKWSELIALALHA